MLVHFFHANLYLTYSRYTHYVERRKKKESKKKSISKAQRVKVHYYKHLCRQTRPGVFFAYFRPDLVSILRLICCPAHLKLQVEDQLERRRIKFDSGNSKQEIIPGYKAFVSVSGAIIPSGERDIGDIFLR